MARRESWVSAKLSSEIIRDARIVVAFTGEGLGEYLHRILAPTIAADKQEVMEAERAGLEPVGAR